MEFLPNPSATYRKFNKNNFKTFTIRGISLHVIADIQTRHARSFNQIICNYTTVGREKIYINLSATILVEMQKMIDEDKFNQSLEYLDNRLSKYSMKNGKCAVSGIFLTTETMHCHHIIPKHLGGTDKFDNLMIVDILVHELIHATNYQTINKYLQLLKLKPKQFEKVNKLRSTCNLGAI